MAVNSMATADATIRYRLTPLQRTLPFLAGGLLGSALVEGVMWANGIAPLASMTRQLLIASISAALLNLVASRNYGVTVTPQAAIVHNARRRLINWVDIQGVEVEDFIGSRTIVLIDTTAKRIRLRAPLSLLDDRFDEKRQVIEACWRAHRERVN
ncbi:hypothetical protein [Streptacidiphilus sp. EB129]|uniref:hypothetical protein n=1 Tax=Streptacidiphilus sp. EB129 TaxID=3156262 RepID=UPI003512C606